MSVVFRDEQARERIAQWHERFRSKITTPTTSRSVPTRFGPTHVLIGGPEEAPPLVLLHGALASSAHVTYELALLLEDHRVYAVDVVGQSVKSADARPSVANNEYGEWLREVLDGLGLERPVVLGVSWGGFVAQRFAHLAPERLRALVLLVPAGMVTGRVWEGFTKMGLPMLWYRLFGGAERRKAFLRNLLTTQDELWEQFLGDAFDSYNMDMRVPALAKDDDFARLQAPVLVVAADRDVSFPGTILLDRAKTLFPKALETELLTDCLHSPPTTDSFRRWLANRIRTFLAAKAPLTTTTS